jgi:hypothetical protein
MFWYPLSRKSNVVRPCNLPLLTPVLINQCDTWTIYSLFLVSLGGVRLSPLGTSATLGLLYPPRMIDDDYGAVGGMRIGRGNRSTRRRPAPVSLCPPQISHDLGSNPGRRGGKPATNRLSYGTAWTQYKYL